jgi:hypothetical protein
MIAINGYSGIRPCGNWDAFLRNRRLYCFFADWLWNLKLRVSQHQVCL